MAFKTLTRMVWPPVTPNRPVLSSMMMIAHAGAANCAATDQRSVPRPADGNGTARCDIGAYEYQRAEPDSCDLNASGTFDAIDQQIWIRRCCRGTTRWVCDVNGDGSTTAAAATAHAEACSASQ